MKIELSRDAVKQLEKLSKDESKKVDRKLRLLESTPLMGKKLSGKLGEEYSVRAWPYRIIYTIIDRDKTILIEKIEHRQGAYK